MASGIVSTRPQGENAPTQGRYADFIQKRMEHIRRQVRLVDVAISLMLLATASLLFFLAVAVLDQWVFQHGLSFLARLGLFALWVAGAGAFAWRYLVPPLVNRINPVFAAQTIEQGRPTLKNSLINFLLLRAHPQDVAPVVYRAMEHRAAADLLKVPDDHALDRGRVVHLACVLAAVVGMFALYLALSPKSPLVSAARVLWPWSSIPAPTRVHIEEVRPGTAIVFNDDHQEIFAQVTGLRDGEEVALLVSTADGQMADDRVVMARVDDADRYRCELPPGSGGFQQDTYYQITAGDASTQKYKLEVQTAPTISVDCIDYHFPSYTGQDDRTIKKQGDIKALEGTLATIHATANMDIQEATIDLGREGLRSLSMTTTGAKATGQFTLRLDSDNKGKAQYDCYQIRFTDTSGNKVRRPIQYHIDVDPDLPPEIEIVEPHQQKVEVAEDGRLSIRVSAFDPDFGLRRVTLHAERGGQNLGLPVLLDRPKPEKAWSKRFQGEYEFRPADLKLKAGDLVRYWATAEDNKEPRPNQSVFPGPETPQRTIRIIGAGQSPRQDPQNQPNNADGPQQDQQQPGQGTGGTKGKPGKSDSSDAAEGSKDGGGSSAERSKPGEKENKSQDPQNKDGKDPDRPDKSGGAGQKKTSSDPVNGQNSEPNPGDGGDEPKKVDPGTQQADAIKKSLDDLEKEKKDQQNQSAQPNGDPKQDQKPAPGQQGSPQQDPGQGGKQPQGNSGDNADQGGPGNPQPQGGNPQPKNSKQDSGAGNSGPAAQGNQPDPNGQSNPNPSSQQSNPGGSPSPGNKDSRNPSSGNQSPSKDSSSKGNESKPSGSPKEGQNGGDASKSNSKPSSVDKGQQNPSTGGDKNSQKPQPGSQQSKDQSTNGGTPPNSEKKPPGGPGSGNESQPAQAGPKSEQAKPSASSGSDSQGTSGGMKPGNKPKDETSNSPGGSQGSKPKQEEKPGGDGKSGGDQQPKPGQGDKEGSSGGGKKSNDGTPGEKNGTGEGEGQKDFGNHGEPTPQKGGDGADAPVDHGHVGKNSGDAHDALNNASEHPQPPGNNSASETPGDRKGKSGGGSGGGKPEQKTGTGPAGSQTAADKGGAISNEHGQGATGKKAGEEVRAADATGSARKEPGKGNGEKEQTANDNSQPPKGDAKPSSTASNDNSSGGPAGAQSSQQAGRQGTGLPAGGSQATGLDKPLPASHEPEGQPDAANLEFTKKQVDLALEHLKEQMAKEKPELLDRLGWTKEETQKFLENMKKLQDSAQQPGSEGEAGKKAYNEFLKNLDLHPHGTQIRRGQTPTDDLQKVRGSDEMEPPGDWANLYRAYSRSTAGQK